MYPNESPYLPYYERRKSSGCHCCFMLSPNFMSNINNDPLSYSVVQEVSANHPSQGQLGFSLWQKWATANIECGTRFILLVFLQKWKEHRRMRTRVKEGLCRDHSQSFRTFRSLPVCVFSHSQAGPGQGLWHRGSWRYFCKGKLYSQLYECLIW